MTRVRGIPLILLLSVLLLVAPAHAADVPQSPSIVGNCLGPFAPSQAVKLRAGSIQTVLPGSVRLSWPLGVPWGDPRVRITNYVDHDPTPQIRDYTGGVYTYEGHRGTDINANSFDDMDRGVPVLAAANGVVISTEDRYYDREILAPQVPGNFVFLYHEDGSTTLYYHLRTNSVCVHPGEYVREGELLGFMGSSGFTTGPHLHFEANTPTGQFDPFSVPPDPPSLWKSQPDYVGDDDATMHDMGVTTFGAFLDAGGLSGWAGFKNHSAQPAIVGADEPTLKMWGLATGHLLKPYALEIRRPDGSLFVHEDFQVPTSNWGQAWQWEDLPWAGHVAPAEYGTWYEQAIVNGAVAATDSFVVGETSRYAPRFFPVGGHSFHLGPTQYDVLTLSFLGAPAESLTFSLEGAPGNVSIATDEFGSTVVTIGPAGPDLANLRSSYFTVVATDPDGRQGRMYYHLVNDAAPLPDAPPWVTAPASVSATEGETVVVHVSAGDPDGDPIRLTADLSNLPGGAATFVVDPGNTNGTLTWPTPAGNTGAYPVAFRAQTALFTNAPPNGVSTSAATTITVTSALRARAFTMPGDRTIRLMAQNEWCLHVEPLDATFDVSDVDPARFALVSQGTGAVSRIAPTAPRAIHVTDTDRNGIPDLPACFAKDDLRQLFSGVVGKRDLTFSLEGGTRQGGAFSIPLEFDVIGTGDRGEVSIVSVTPNPTRGGVALSFQTAPGARSRVEVFDVAGRRVREMDLGVGGGEVRSAVWDGLDGRGSRAPGGVYWLRLSSGGQRVSQRVVLLRTAK